MKLKNQIHNSKTHREGFDPNCPQCLSESGIAGVIGHLKDCAAQNDADGAKAVAGEQRRMVGVLSALAAIARAEGGAA